MWITFMLTRGVYITINIPLQQRFLKTEAILKQTVFIIDRFNTENLRLLAEIFFKCEYRLRNEKGVIK